MKPTDPVAFTLLCLDRKTGKTVWEKVVKEEIPHEGHHPDHGFSSHSPVTDGKVVIAYFGSRGLHCFDLAGNVKWSKDLGKMQTKMSFGEGSSPSLHGDTVVVNWDHEGDDFIAAFKRDSGDEIWRQPREEDTSWSTPLIVTIGGKPQVVTTATRRIRSYDLTTGKQLWEHAGLTPNSIPTAVHGDGVVFATSGFRGNALFAIKLGKEGDLTGTDSVLWSHNRQTPYVPSPLLYQGRLYFFSGNTGILSAYDAKTGKPLIDASRIEGLQGVYASPIGAGGRVYLVGRNGTTVVIKAADTLEILSTNALEDRMDASPAAAGKELFLRGHEYLYCISQ
jgi:outer membrane protein assembly factor BamB